jgi:hypothetical protein
MKLPRFSLLILLSVMLLAGSVNAQELKLIDPDIKNLIKQEISGDAAYEHIRHNTQFHRPRGGADGLMEVARYYEKKAREYGFEDVQLILQDYTIVPWNAKEAELWITGHRPERIASYLQTPLHLADYSASADVETELVYVGEGSSGAHYEGQSVEGKIVLGYGNLTAMIREAVWNRGAEGVVWFRNPMQPFTGLGGVSVNYADQVPWTRIPTQNPDGGQPGFAFVLTMAQGIELRDRVVNSSEPVTVHAYVDSEYDSAEGEEPWQVMVEAYIKGTNPDIGQDIVLTGHMQEEKFSANDDASGTANILEIGRALKKLIDSGKLERPERNIRFWWLTEFSSQRQYFADYPEAHHRMWVNINQDMVGADQSQDVLRTQNVTRLPATRFHFFNDVTEAVIDYMVATNTSHLSQLQAGSQNLYTKPHMSRLGSRHRYNAEMIWFHGNTDHVPFNEAPIGVPGISFTNFPDNYIHTSDDDLWNIDRTQLGRNAAAGALIAWIMATASSERAPDFAVETLQRGGERMALNTGIAFSLIRSERGGQNYQMAVEQIEYAAARELQAVESMAQIGGVPQAVISRKKQIVENRKAKAMEELRSMYELFHGSSPPRGYTLTSAERELRSITPVLSAGPREFQTGRGQVRGVPGLHNLMAMEILSAVNGERTGLDIYRLAAAQAREAGAHYYGTITREAVKQYLENARNVGLIEF